MSEPETIVNEPEPAPVAAPEPEPEPDEGTEPDEGGDETHEPLEKREPAPEQQAVMDARFDASQKALKTYTSKLSTIFEEDALRHIPCPLCPDLHKGFIDVQDAGNVPEEIKAVVMEYMGFARPIDLRPDPVTRTCDTCDGEGKTATGSRVSGNDWRTCPKCHGFGYTPPPEQGTNGAGAASDFHAPVGEHASPLEEPDNDVAGEPRLLPDGRVNPNYGKWPQYKVLVHPWGVTAGLTVQDSPV